MSDGHKTRVRVLRVFTDAQGDHGNPLGVVCEASALSPQARQALAKRLGYSETVFVDAGDRLQIFTPAVELPFAGHPLVGAAWLLGRSPLHPPAGVVAARVRGDFAAVLARPEWAPGFERRELPSPADVDALPQPASGSLQVWAWQDRARGLIRARVFAPDLGVSEDPATGSAAIALCAALGREITIVQGPGCEIKARPAANGLVELGGRVADGGELEL